MNDVASLSLKVVLRNQQEQKICSLAALLFAVAKVLDVEATNPIWELEISTATTNQKKTATVSALVRMFKITYCRVDVSSNLVKKVENCLST